MARPNVKELIESNLDNIEQWTRDGLTMKQIADNLGISDRTLYRYKSDSDSQLNQSIKNGRAVAVETLENTMFMSANGYTRTVKKYAKVRRCMYDNGKKSEEWEEMVEYEEEIYYPPDTTAGIFLLKNWGNYMNEPRAMEIRKKEIELKEKQIEANLW
jgi:transcriptional regulator with XRE-family HTH domain